jgi:hypothetical protein
VDQDRVGRKKGSVNGVTGKVTGARKMPRKIDIRVSIKKYNIKESKANPIKKPLE